MLVNIKEEINMTKKKKNESPTKEFRQVTQVTLGAGIASDMVPLMKSPCQAPDKFGNMIGFAMVGKMSNVAFDAVDDIYKSGTKKKRK